MIPDIVLEQLNVIIDYVLAVGCSTLSVLSSMYTLKSTQPGIEWIPNLVNAIFHAVCLVWSKFSWNPAKTFQWKCVKGYIIGFLPIYNG